MKIGEITNIKNAQKRWDKFYNTIVYTLNEEKEQHKEQKLGNGMKIKGIGKKCLKIENNFYSWEDIENIASRTETSEDNTYEYILEYLFEDYTATKKEESIPQKWERNFAIEHFAEIRETILKNKQNYKRGNILGIGEKTIKTGRQYDEEYIKWEEILKILKKGEIKDYALTHNMTYYDICIVSIIEELFYDATEETQEEKRLREEKDPLTTQKGYIYRHIIKGNITVEKIRQMVYITITDDKNKKEEVVNDLLQYAFTFCEKVKFTEEEYDEIDSKKYAVKDGNSYFYTIEDQELVFEGETAHFKDIPEVSFSSEKDYVLVARDDATPRRISRREIYVKAGKKLAYTLSVPMQVEILAHSHTTKTVEEEDIRSYFLEMLDNEHSEIGEEIREVLSEQYSSFSSKEVYDSLRTVQLLAREMYCGNKILRNTLFKALNGVTSEKHVNPDKIMDFISWGDGSNKKHNILQSKYGFDKKTKEETIRIGPFNAMSVHYAQNCEYTRVSQQRAGIDSYSVEEVYLQGDISKEDAPYYLFYAYAVWLLEDSLKYGYVYEEEGEERRGW